MKKGRIDDVFIHASSEVSPLATIGRGTKIWRWSHIEEYSIIGNNCLIAQNVHIAAGVKIGNRVRIHDNVSIYRGVTIEDDCFISPSVVFMNLKYPKINKPAIYSETVIKRGTTIGANATISCGIIIGEHSFIGAGSVVTKDIPSYSLVVGNPAHIVKKLSQDWKEFDKNE